MDKFIAGMNQYREGPGNIQPRPSRTTTLPFNRPTNGRCITPPYFAPISPAYHMVGTPHLVKAL